MLDQIAEDESKLVFDALVECDPLALLAVGCACRSLHEKLRPLLSPLLGRLEILLLQRASLTPVRFERTRNLKFDHTSLGNAGCAVLARLLHSSGALVVTLDVSGNKIGSSGAASLFSAFRAGAAPRLRELCLQANALGDAAMPSLATAACALRSLRTLRLEQNSIGDGFVDLVDELQRRQQGADQHAERRNPYAGCWTLLNTLTLDHNQLGDRSFCALADLLAANGLPSLELLELSANVGSGKTAASPTAQQAIADACEEREFELPWLEVVYHGGSGGGWSTNKEAPPVLPRDATIATVCNGLSTLQRTLNACRLSADDATVVAGAP